LSLLGAAPIDSSASASTLADEGAPAMADAIVTDGATTSMSVARATRTSQIDSTPQTNGTTTATTTANFVSNVGATAAASRVASTQPPIDAPLASSSQPPLQPIVDPSLMYDVDADIPDETLVVGASAVSQLARIDWSHGPRAPDDGGSNEFIAHIFGSHTPTSRQSLCERTDEPAMGRYRGGVRDGSRGGIRGGGRGGRRGGRTGGGLHHPSNRAAVVTSQPHHAAPPWTDLHARERQHHFALHTNTPRHTADVRTREHEHHQAMHQQHARPTAMQANGTCDDEEDRPITAMHSMTQMSCATPGGYRRVDRTPADAPTTAFTGRPMSAIAGAAASFKAPRATHAMGGPSTLAPTNGHSSEWRNASHRNASFSSSAAPSFSGGNPTNGRHLLPRASTPPSSGLVPPSDCSLRFYSPSYFRQFGRGRLPNFHLSVQPAWVSVVGPDGVTKPSQSIFATPESYAEFFTRLICQDIQGRINKVCIEFDKHVTAYSQTSSQSSSRGGLPAASSFGHFDTAASRNFIPTGPRVGPGLESYLRRRGLHYYDTNSIELNAFNVQQWSKASIQRARVKASQKQHKLQLQRQLKKRKRANAGLDVEPDEDDSQEEIVLDGDESLEFDVVRAHPDGFRHYLVSTQASSKEKSSEYGEGDLWIVSSDPLFNLSGTARSDAQVGPASQRTPQSFFPPSTRHNYILFACSDWRSFSGARQKLEISAVPLHPAHPNTKLLRDFQSEHTKAYGLRLADFHAECIMLEVLNHQRSGALEGTRTLRQMPLLPYILHGAHWQQFQSAYDATSGVWLSDVDRINQERRHAQGLKQSTLIDCVRSAASDAGTGGGSAGGAVSTKPPSSFTPLSDPATHLLAATPITRAVVDSIKADVLATCALNADQRKVLESVAAWFWTQTEKSEEELQEEREQAQASATHADADAKTTSFRIHPPTACPIQLVHGCFGSGEGATPSTRQARRGLRSFSVHSPSGCSMCVCLVSGKSYLLVVLIVFLTRVFDIVDKEKKIKIMIASLTNVAGHTERTRASARRTENAASEGA
jgi:hypothetical protein